MAFCNARKTPEGEKAMEPAQGVMRQRVVLCTDTYERGRTSYRRVTLQRNGHLEPGRQAKGNFEASCLPRKSVSLPWLSLDSVSGLKLPRFPD